VSAGLELNFVVFLVRAPGSPIKNYRVILGNQLFLRYGTESHNPNEKMLFVSYLASMAGIETTEA
jgi:hypothetical protein